MNNKQLFDKIYNETYHDILRYIICKCSNIEDVNDILQEVYLEFYKILCKKEITDNHLRAYLYKIANYKIKKHYSLLSKLRFKSTYHEDDFVELIKDDVDIEKIVFDNETCVSIWDYIKDNKNVIVSKIFYLYYYEEHTIKEISEMLCISESQVKNNLYRTNQEIKKQFLKDGEYYE
ncbi:MAG: sigma-70 family RNA polymerase sigma factor [Coprobacillus sp.]